MSFTRIALAVSLVAAASTAQAAIVSFTNSTLAGVSPALSAATPTLSPTYGGADLCSGLGDRSICSTSLSYNTAVGALTVTAQDGPGVDRLALVNQSTHNNAGLGVVSGYHSNLLNKFVIVDANHSLSAGKETMTLSFANQVSISQLFFFPDDRGTRALTRELDPGDGFTVSVDGGAFVEYSFGSMAGQAVSFSSALVGNTFTFGYAKHKSPEDYFLAGLNVTQVVTPAVPEASSLSLLAAGLAAVGGLAVRRRKQA